MGERTIHKARRAFPFDYLTRCGARVGIAFIRLHWRKVTCKRCLRLRPAGDSGKDGAR